MYQGVEMFSISVYVWLYRIFISQVYKVVICQGFMVVSCHSIWLAVICQSKELSSLSVYGWLSSVIV